MLFFEILVIFEFVDTLFDILDIILNFYILLCDI